MENMYEDIGEMLSCLSFLDDRGIMVNEKFNLFEWELLTQQIFALASS